MATVDITPSSAVLTAGSHSDNGFTRKPYSKSVFVTGAAALAAKGSALAAADVIQFLDIPPKTVVLGALIDVITADTGTTATVDLGYGGNVDVFSDGVDISGSTGMGALGTNGKVITSAALFTVADTLDLTLATYSGSNDDWVIRVEVLFLDVSGPTVVPNSAS